VGQIPDVGWIVRLEKPQPMKATIPTHKTKAPSREGLAFHEILADGLVHTAHVFGIADDEKFVERVLCIAWTNAARLVQSNFRQAATLARSLHETLEVGQAESEVLCQKVAEAMAVSDIDPFVAIQAYYAEKEQSRTWEKEGNDYDDQIRQLIGEAILGGLYSRARIPEVYQALIAHVEKLGHEHRFISNRLIFWADHKGLPRFHPFMELCVTRYKTVLERDLLCEGLGNLLPDMLDESDPWSLERWLKPGWKDGIMAAKFAPDEVKAVIEILPQENWAFTQKLFKECIQKTETADGLVNLPAAFAIFVKEYNPSGFAAEGEGACNPRLLAWCGYDFAFWMGVVAELVRP